MQFTLDEPNLNNEDEVVRHNTTFYQSKPILKNGPNSKPKLKDKNVQRFMSINDDVDKIVKQ